MSHLPVIVSFGGANAAGRSSGHNSYKRIIIDRLNSKEAGETCLGLATLMELVKYEDGKFVDKDGEEILPEDAQKLFGEHIMEHTLLRRIHSDFFDADKTLFHRKMKCAAASGSDIRFEIAPKDLPRHIPSNWKIKKLGDDRVEVRVKELEFYFPDTKKAPAQSAGQLPLGFNPGKFYNSRNHPRGIQMTVFGANDAVNSLGIDWEQMKNLVPPDQIGVYASSGLGQFDPTGHGGFAQSHLLGKRVSSKQMIMGLTQMPADFINAYILGTLGQTGAQVAACATFLYNLYAACRDISSGKRRIAIVGNSEAPLIQEAFEGFRAMGALGEDHKLLKLDKHKNLKTPDYRRSCRPFSDNCGLVISESCQFITLFDDDLVLETGAQIFGSVGDININADGFKKSITSPGFGNYISLAKTLASARSILGEESLRRRTYMSAHGTGTPLNKSTESRGLNEVAKAFKIEKWPISAVKCYLGHSLSAAAGDQLANILGVWKHGIIPGIFTLDQIAEDVHHSHLLLSQEHLEVGVDGQDGAFINSKGFGGNNATGLILSPRITLKMLEQKHGGRSLSKYKDKNQSVEEKAEEYERLAVKGLIKTRYNFGENVLGDDDLDMTDREMTVPGYKQKINLNPPHPYPEMAFKKD